MIIYLPARTLLLGFGDTPGVPPDVIYQDIFPFFFGYLSPTFLPSNAPMSILVSNDHV